MKAGPVRAALAVIATVAATFALLAFRAKEGSSALLRRGLRRDDQRGHLVMDNLAFIVFGLLVISLIGVGVSGLATKVINWATGQLKLG